ncbi:MAG: DUF1343 domain-containing protein [Clostridia bacterium]|nr:DUF1343 domain-containing protein [Clostridia bacterium]
MKLHVTSGADRLQSLEAKLQGKRVGLMTNPTGIDHSLRSTIDTLYGMGHLDAMFAVEHGIRGMEQAGAAVATQTDPETGLTVYSAFGKTSHFTDEMLDAFDILIFDIQDVGARFYTYLYSLSYAMEACARAGKEMVVLDRVNPIGGVKQAGTILDTRFSSFVGDYALPTRYALTIGEYALYVKDYLKLDVHLTVVTLEGWERRAYLDETDLPWVAPSPNCPDLAAALCYIGTCIFEGTNVSEGRGTTQPFQLIGAPFLDGAKLAKRLNDLRLPGVHYRPAAFTPTFSKHQGTPCQGVQLHITDREAAEPFTAGLCLLDAVREQAGEKFAFISWDGEQSFAIDKLLGTDRYRAGNLSAKELVEISREGNEQFRRLAKEYHLYK